MKLSNLVQFLFRKHLPIDDALYAAAGQQQVVPKVIGQQLLIAENMKPERQQVIHRQSLNSNSTKSSLLAKALA